MEGGGNPSLQISVFQVKAAEQALRRAPAGAAGAAKCTAVEVDRALRDGAVASVRTQIERPQPN